MTRLLVVDDHDVVRQGLVTSLKTHGYTSIETAATIKESRSKVAAFNPEAMIVDINLPDGSGLELVQWIRKISATVAIIVLSLNEPSLFAHLARRAGANAYISKSRPIDEIISTLNFAVANPGSFTSSLTIAEMGLVELTPREIDLLHLLARGASNLEISSTLYISVSTVKTHISSILRKLESTNRTMAIKVAREKGLLP
jgi:DNA-binding NarL/FixJ family response regulator